MSRGEEGRWGEEKAGYSIKCRGDFVWKVEIVGDGVCGHE